MNGDTKSLKTQEKKGKETDSRTMAGKLREYLQKNLSNQNTLQNKTTHYKNVKPQTISLSTVSELPAPQPQQ